MKMSPIQLRSALLTALCLGPPALADDLLLVLGHAEVRAYARAPATIILGDQEIAAANITPSDVLVLTGLAPGTTNVIVLDETGGELDRFLLSVVNLGSDIAIRRGNIRQVVRCDPSCRTPEEADEAPTVNAN